MHMPEPGARRPRVAVLLATYNGRKWLPEQVATILDQEGVDVSLVALDDGSTDGTREWLAELAAVDDRVIVLESDTPSGSSAANFYRLIARAPVDGSDLVAFSDQDDLWRPGKLARHAALIADHGYDAVSSSVMSFTAAGGRTIIRKDYPQRGFDYLCESPGPGCSFLMTPRLVDLTRHTLAAVNAAHEVDFHDSLIYAIARGRGWRWHIDGWPSLDYRQHDNNVLGANVGRASAVARLDLIRRHWHRAQAVAMARVALSVSTSDTRAGVQGMLDLMTTPGIRSRAALARVSGQLRRRPRDRRILGLLIAAGIW